MKIVVFALISLIMISGCVQQPLSDDLSNSLQIDDGQESDVKILPDDFGTLNYSSDLITQAEEKISLAEEKINEAKEKDLSSFLENALDIIVGMLEESKQELENANESFGNQDYFNASEQATSALNKATVVIINADKILEGRTSENLGRVEGTSTIIATTPSSPDCKNGDCEKIAIPSD